MCPERFAEILANSGTGSIINVDNYSKLLEEALFFANAECSDVWRVSLDQGNYSTNSPFTIQSNGSEQYYSTGVLKISAADGILNKQYWLGVNAW